MYHIINTRWVQRELTDHHKEIRLQVCTELKQCYMQEGDAFLDRILSRNDTWIHHFEPECPKDTAKSETICVHLSGKFQSPTISGENHFEVFWDAKGPFLCFVL